MQSNVSNDRDSLVAELKTLIVDSVNLHHMDKNLIKADTPFDTNGLNLDSVDILEVVVCVEQKYNLKVKDASVGRKYFVTIGGIADFILENRS